MNELDKTELERIINQAKKLGVVLAVIFSCLFTLFAAKKFGY